MFSCFESKRNCMKWGREKDNCWVSHYGFSRKNRFASDFQIFYSEKSYITEFHESLYVYWHCELIFIFIFFFFEVLHTSRFLTTVNLQPERTTCLLIILFQTPPISMQDMSLFFNKAQFIHRYNETFRLRTLARQKVTKAYRKA